jgi:hypothetical protein
LAPIQPRPLFSNAFVIEDEYAYTVINYSMPSGAANRLPVEAIIASTSLENSSDKNILHNFLTNIRINGPAHV